MLLIDRLIFVSFLNYKYYIEMINRLILIKSFSLNFYVLGKLYESNWNIKDFNILNILIFE